MKQRLLIFGVFILIAAALVGLNAASYVQTETVPDTELSPNRSTFNSGTTGTLAFYTLLEETGRNVSRWQTPIRALGPEQAGLPDVFVMVGGFRRQISNAEATELLRWVSNGGRLVIIDREPPAELAVTSGSWTLDPAPKYVNEIFTVDPANVKEMTAETEAMVPVQPSIFTAGVNAVQPSRFASSLNFEYVGDAAQYSGDPHIYGTGGAPQMPNAEEQLPNADPPPPVEEQPAEVISPGPVQIETSRATAEAPVVLIGTGDLNLLTDVPFGRGNIVFLTDPYIISNSGVTLVDNAQLAINLVTRGTGRIVFDEYHHGYGAGDNRFLEYFEHTPAASIFLQCVILLGLALVSASRRFARPLPDPDAAPDRLAKLEYVAAMAELQKRTRAYDLAMENIYADFRRRAARLFGVDNLSTRHTELAGLIAGRIKADPADVARLLFKCEEIMHGEPSGRKEMIYLTGRLREIERQLGLTRSSVQTAAK